KLYIIECQQVACTNDTVLCLFDGLVEHTLNKAHTHARKLEATAVQDIEHHLDTGTFRMHLIFARNFQVDGVQTIGNQVQTGVIKKLLDDYLLLFHSVVGYEKVD